MAGAFACPGVAMDAATRRRSHTDEQLHILVARWEYVVRSVEPEQADDMRPWYDKAADLLLDARLDGHTLTVDEALAQASRLLETSAR